MGTVRWLRLVFPSPPSIVVGGMLIESQAECEICLQVQLEADQIAATFGSGSLSISLRTLA